jgi:hypothetical protein
VGYAPNPIPAFNGGLNIRDKEDAVDPTQAIDLLNVEFTDLGAVKQRAGTDALTAALTNAPDSLEPFYRTSGANQLIAGCGSRLEALAVDGSVVSSLTGLTASLIWDFARFGTPGNEYIYAGNGTDTIKRWTGAAWSSPAGMPYAQCLAVQATDNRLVAGGFTTGNTTGGPTGGASTSSPSHVYFSDVGTGETWTTANFVQLTPGDGETITACIAWREFVFVFKQTKFFVFYGNSTDSAGNPIFNYRPVDAGVGAVGPRAVVAARDGVYFASRRGIYRTQGDEPEKISDIIDPYFDPSQSVSDFYLGGRQQQNLITNVALGYHAERLYVGSTTTGTANNRTLVYEPEHDWWTLWDLPAACLTSFRIADNEELVFGVTSTKIVQRHNPTYLNDDGVAITSRWRSGWFDAGEPSRKTIRETKAWGTGQPFYSLSSNFNTDIGSLVQLDFSNAAATSAFWNVQTWNVSTWADGITLALDHALDRTAQRGEVFSAYFENSILSQGWSVHRLHHHYRGPRRRPTPTNT